MSTFLQDQKALFECNDNEGHTGQFVYIRDDREDKEYFGLCEVEVFEHKGDHETPFTPEPSSKELELGDSLSSRHCVEHFLLAAERSMNTARSRVQPLKLTDVPDGRLKIPSDTEGTVPITFRLTQSH